MLSEAECERPRQEDAFGVCVCEEGVENVKRLDAPPRESFQPQFYVHIKRSNKPLPVQLMNNLASLFYH